MHNDYRPYVYKLANLDTKYHKVLNLDNLFKKYAILGCISLLSAIIFEIIIDIVTNATFFIVNFVRVLEYEPKIDFLSHGFSVLVLGNFVAAILIVVYSLGVSTRKFLATVRHYIHGAQKEIKENEKFEAKRAQKEKAK